MGPKRDWITHREDRAEEPGPDDLNLDTGEDSVESLPSDEDEEGIEGTPAPDDEEETRPD
ncbi:MAG: hypothetical protein QJR07_09255 [Acetobacteraceae bacterium]|nr:hypothetical protein [Acetobacteraceae bacterium]